MDGTEPIRQPGVPALMDRTNRIARSVATAGVALFLVTGAVLGAQSLTQTPSGADGSQLSVDQTAEPTETLEAIGTAEPTSTAEPTETTELAATAEPTETADPAAAAAATDAAETVEPGDDNGGQREVEA